MKTSKLKFTTFLLFISFLTVISLSYCGQKESISKTEPVIDTVTQPVKMQSVTADNQVAVPAEQLIKESKDNTKNELKAEPPKEIIVTNKKKEPGTEKKFQVQTEKKSDPVTVIQPADNKTVINIDKIPDVVITESEMPKQQKPTQKVDVPKPVTVVNPADDDNGWVILAKYRYMTNPYPDTRESIQLGKTLYSTHCQSCHGNRGNGKGPKAATLDTKIGSFIRPEFKELRQGEVYYMSIVGRKDMPRFDKKIPDEEDQWAIVAYIMSLK